MIIEFGRGRYSHLFVLAKVAWPSQPILRLLEASRTVKKGSSGLEGASGFPHVSLLIQQFDGVLTSLELGDN